MVKATIEDLAITTRSSKESDAQTVSQLRKMRNSIKIIPFDSKKWAILNKHVPFLTGFCALFPILKNKNNYDTVWQSDGDVVLSTTLLNE
jgi:hypothetical protein